MAVNGHAKRRQKFLGRRHSTGEVRFTGVVRSRPAGGDIQAAKPERRYLQSQMGRYFKPRSYCPKRPFQKNTKKALPLDRLLTLKEALCSSAVLHGFRRSLFFLLIFDPAE